MGDQLEQNRNLTLLGAAHSLNHSLFLITPPLLSLLMTSLGVTKFEIGFASTIASMRARSSVNSKSTILFTLESFL